MHRSHSILLASAVAGALTAASPAAAVVVAPAGTNAATVTVARGPAGKALLTWIADGRRVEVSEFVPGRGFGVATPVLETASAGYVAFGALAPDRLVVLATRGTTGLPTEAVAVEREAGAPAFRAPTTIATAQYAEIDAVASNAGGDIAAVIRTGFKHAVLVTAPRGGAFGAPEEIGAGGGHSDTQTVAVGPRGQVVVAYYDGRSRAFVQQGRIGSALGAPHLLSQTRTRPDFSAAFDDVGNATVAYARNLSRNELGVVVARARSGHGFGPVRVLARSRNVQLSQVAAAGTTTAVSWHDLTSTRGVRVAVAHGAGRFGAPQAPVASAFRLHGEAGRYASQAGFARIAVGARGDLLVAYPYGPFNAVHVSVRSAGRRSFAAPRVVSAVGRGGSPQPTLTTRSTPVIAWVDSSGAVRATSHVSGRAVDRRAPGLTLAPISDDELASQGIVTTTLRCSTTCAFGVTARITTGRGRGQVITRRYLRPAILRGGRTLQLRFEAKPNGRDAFVRTGRAQAKVIVTAANASGAARTVRRVLELGRRWHG